jgi:hypothetical protein
MMSRPAPGSIDQLTWFLITDGARRSDKNVKIKTGTRWNFGFTIYRIANHPDSRILYVASIWLECAGNGFSSRDKLIQVKEQRQTSRQVIAFGPMRIEPSLVTWRVLLPVSSARRGVACETAFTFVFDALLLHANHVGAVLVVIRGEKRSSETPCDHCGV